MSRGELWSGPSRIGADTPPMGLASPELAVLERLAADVRVIARAARVFLGAVAVALVMIVFLVGAIADWWHLGR